MTFPSGNDRCAAWYYTRGDGGEDTPIVVMAHGFAGVRRLRLDRYAERFADAGYRVLLFDYRHFGDSTGEPRQLLDIDRQLADWRSAITYTRSLTSAGRTKLVLWGTSLGGGHVLTTAAIDPDVAAVIARFPPVSGVAAARSVGPVMGVRLAALGLSTWGLQRWGAPRITSLLPEHLERWRP